MGRKIVLTVCFTLIAMQAFSQDENQEEKGMKGSFRITTGLGHTHLSEGKNTGGKTVWLLTPSWSLNCDLWISNKWAVGLQNDVVLENFIVEEDGNDVERKNPWAIVTVGIFKPGKHLSFIAGAGIELEKEENLGLTRLGIEYSGELPKGWEAGIALVWDDKWHHYNSWVLEFTFSKIFFKKR